jgi:hypothetical protein
MFKSKTSDKIDFSNTTLVLFFPGKGNSTSFALSLLKSNYDFKNIGYLYSEYLASSVSNSSDGKSLEFNGTFYFNSSKKLTILDLTGGVKSRELNEFADELIKFIKDSKFSKIYIVGSSSKDNVLDEDLLSKIINIYYLTNDSSEQIKCNIKNIKDAFKVKDEERKGKTYYEMNLVESCDSLKRVVQKLILEKMKFLFIFGFAEPLFDPFCGLGLFNKISLLLGLNNADKEVNKVELDNLSILDHFEKQGIKIDNSWKILFKLE